MTPDEVVLVLNKVASTNRIDLQSRRVRRLDTSCKEYGVLVLVFPFCRQAVPHIFDEAEENRVEYLNGCMLVRVETLKWMRENSRTKHWRTTPSEKRVEVLARLFSKPLNDCSDYLFVRPRQ